MLLIVSCCQNVSSQTPEAAQETTGIFPIPDGLATAEQYFEFIEETASNHEPEDGSEVAMIAFQRKLGRTVVKVVDKILALEPEKEEVMQSYYFQLQALRMLNELEEPGAEEQFYAAIDAARADERSDVRAVGMKFLVENGFAKWPVWGKEEKEKLLSEIVAYFKKDKPDVYQLDMLLTVINVLTEMRDEQFIKPLLAESMDHFRQSDDESIRNMLKRLEGMARRLDLPGNKIELSGTLMDGSQLDWKSYQGKIVLVDFWATWCGPCRQEVPNILRLYRGYHEKGFEVVGINLDATKEAAESYIDQYNIPWVNLFSPNEQQRRWEHPMAVYYGVTGIPQAILVDRDGTVIHMLARGEILARELRRLLGEPVASSEVVEDSLIRQVDTAAGSE